MSVIVMEMFDFENVNTLSEQDYVMPHNYKAQKH